MVIIHLTPCSQNWGVTFVAAYVLWDKVNTRKVMVAQKKEIGIEVT